MKPLMLPDFDVSEPTFERERGCEFCFERFCNLKKVDKTVMSNASTHTNTGT